MSTANTQQWTTIVDGDSKKTQVDFKGLTKCRDLILLLVRRSFVAQYKQTILGPAWAVLQPFFTTVVYSIFFGNVAGLGAEGIPNFVFYLSGTVIWGLFASCLGSNSDVFRSNSNILSKVYFPRLVFPISSMISQFITFAIRFGFMLCFVLYYLLTTDTLHPNLLILMTPVLVLHISLLGTGCGIIISSLTTKYRDFTMLVGFGTSLWSYCSPIAYDMFGMSVFAPGGKFHTLYMLNPITPIVNIFRNAYLGIGTVEWNFYIISLIFTVVIVSIGMKMFAKVEKSFIDTI